ncbi:MAG: pyruvate dehydrogenase (acetyl-transferring) E1 component subunit alpha [Calditrichaeota bacterium]|nr:pyruvate dehydrogenase (acetyl-transferring) E1 component subunit alpha [Calditrichota bacterium]MCB9369007.1 pyruvate dehydrogenase (acetyl-transferring) E1 component subunit alpha [Calditrichota bacterium]
MAAETKTKKTDKTNGHAGAKPTSSLFDAYDATSGKKLEILDPNGKVLHPEWMPEMSDELLLEGYKMMKYARIVDLKAVNLQRQGKLYTLPVNRGQEAAAVGSAMALRKDDWMVPAFREIGAYMWHGVPVETVYKWYLGLESGAVMPEGVNSLPTSVPISSQIPHAAGIGHAINYKGLDQAVLCYFGDGGTSEGDFSEGLNWAAVFTCPCVFFCNNNQYAISVPRDQQTKAATIAQKAVGFGLPGIQVDGNDLFAVYRATKEAVDFARAGNGPVLIEAVTYRMGAHTTSDDPTKYRTHEEEKIWEPRDPLIRVKKYLEEKKLWSDKDETSYEEECAAKVDAVVQRVVGLGPNPIHELFEHQYENLTNSLIEQKADIQAFIDWQVKRG